MKSRFFFTTVTLQITFSFVSFQCFFFKCQQIHSYFQLPVFSHEMSKFNMHIIYLLHSVLIMYFSLLGNDDDNYPSLLVNPQILFY